MESKHQIEKLIRDVSDILLINGTLVLTFRDYSDKLSDQQRFIPVKSSSDRILTCILEYEQETIKVTDLLYEKINERWEQKVSSYEKVRIPTEKIVEFIERAGMNIMFNRSIYRTQTIIAKKQK